jgi:WD40 repeat protein
MKFHTENHPEEVVECIAVAPNGAIAVGTFRPYSSCAVYVFDDQGLPLQKLPHNFPVASLMFCPLDSSLLVTVSDQIRVWDAISGKLHAVVSPHAIIVSDEKTSAVIDEVCPFTAIDFSTDSSYTFAVTDTRGTCSVWDAQTRKPIEVFQLGTDEKLYSVSFVSPNVIGCVSETGALYIIDRTSQKVVCSNAALDHIAILPRSQPVKLAWLHLHNLVAIAFQTSGLVAVFQINSLSSPSPRLLGTTKASHSTCESIADISWDKLHPQYLVVARDSGVVQVYHKGNLESPHFDSRTPLGASALAWTKDGGLLIGNISGEVVKTQLPADTMETGGPFAFATPINYPALA